MTSKELHAIVYLATGKYAKLANFHDVVKKVLHNQLDSILLSAQKLPNGHIAYYNLNEIQSNMVMASIDYTHLELVTRVFVKAKNENLPKPMSILEMVIASAQQALRIEKEQERLALEQQVLYKWLQDHLQKHQA